MKRLVRRISRVADSSQYHHLRPGKAAAAEEGWIRRRRRTPEGHVPVYVGEEMERFAVRADLLGRPAFVELLQRSAQEYGYEQRGVLRIPCPVPLFRRVLLALSDDADIAVEDLFRSPSD
ncbi:auxin-responsive protein SAUR71-like [Typha angustifolia]|uniref:auxin-responsive protein SAUR71-like n=1 Tax=Typha angustifolia TaxID=59011 RepID=UPI003C2E6B1C